MHRRTLRPTPRLVALACAATLAAALAQAAPVDIDLPAQPLPDAIKALARATGTSIAADSALLAGKAAPAVRGRLEPGDALARLLAGSGLEAVAQPQGGWTLRPATAIGASLSEVRVTAQAGRESPTEGSRAYTTPVTRTATGLTLAPRDTPQSISIVTRERMDEQGMSTVLDTLRHTTGVSYEPWDRGRGAITARGFSVSKYQFDGVPVSSGNVGIETSNAVLYDRVEVLRGATGLLTGTGDASATVNLVRKRPRLADGKTFTGKIGLELGSWDHRAATADLSMALNADASVRARLVAHANQHDAFIDLERTRNQTFYGVVEADLDSRTRLSVGASDQEDRRYGVTWVGLPYWYTDGTRTSWRRSQTIAPDWNIWHTREQTTFATLEHQFDNRWTLRATLDHYRQVEESKLLWSWGDPDRTTGLGMEGVPYHYLTRPTQNAAGLIASGPFTLLGREHEATIGIAHNRDQGQWSNRDPLDGISVLPSIYGWDGSFAEPPMGERVAWDKQINTQTGIYAATRLQISDRVKFILGGRVTRWRRDVKTEDLLTARYEENDVVTPYAGVVADLNDQWSAYASYTDIFKPQTQRDRNGKFLDPLIGKNYETGLKGELLEGRLQASAAIFRIQQDNFGVMDEGFLVPGTTVQAYYAAEGVTAKGYELEVAGMLSPGWNLGAGWTHFSARDASGADVQKQHPRKQLKVFTSYRLPGAWHRLTLGGGVNWQSENLTTATNPGTGQTEHVGQASYALVDLMARYELTGQTSVQLNIANALDKRYMASSGSTYLWGEPRRVLVTLNHGF